MLIRRFASLLILSGVPLAAQIVNNTVTVTASQSPQVQPDKGVFSVTVGSGLNKSLDDAVAAISSLGITAANLVAVNTPNQLIGVGSQPPAAPGLVLDLSTDGSPFENQRHHFRANRVAEIYLPK